MNLETNVVTIQRNHLHLHLENACLSYTAAALQEVLCTLASGLGEEQQPRWLLLSPQEVLQSGQCQCFHVSAIHSNPGIQKTRKLRQAADEASMRPSCWEVRKMVRLGERGRREDAMGCWSHATRLTLRVSHWAQSPLSEVGSSKQGTFGIPIHEETQANCSALLIQLL